MIRLIRLINRVLFSIIFAYFAWMRKYYKHKEKYPRALRFYKVQTLIRKVVKYLYVDFKIENLDELYKDDKRKFIVCNHQSMFDALTFIALAKRPITFVSKKETEKFIFVGKIISIIDGEFIDRENLKQQVRVILNVEKKLKSNSYDVVIFPEGTRLKDPCKDLNEFHPGTFKVPSRSGCDMALMSFFGTFRVLQFLKYKKTHMPVQVAVINLIKNENIKDLSSFELAELSYKEMNKKTHEMCEIDKKLFNS